MVIGPYDREAVVDALVAVGQMAADNSDAIEALDINPFVALSPGDGAYALDALAVLTPADRGLEQWNSS